jgi:hypothetical protein
MSNATIETYPVSGAAYPGKIESTLTHAVDMTTEAPLCRKVKASSILLDGAWGDTGSKPTCPCCAKRDPRFK